MFYVQFALKIREQVDGQVFKSLGRGQSWTHSCCALRNLNKGWWRYCGGAKSIIMIYPKKNLTTVTKEKRIVNIFSLFCVYFTSMARLIYERSSRFCR